MSESINPKKRSPNHRRRRAGLAFLLAGAFASAGCAEGQLAGGKTVAAGSDKTECSILTANSKIKGNYACVERQGDTRTIKLLTLENKVFAKVIQECSGKLSVSSYIVGLKDSAHVPMQVQPFIDEPVCLDGLHDADGGRLNRHIPEDALPNESVFLKHN